MRADRGARMNLLNTVYSQSWPAPDPIRGPRKGFYGTAHSSQVYSQECAKGGLQHECSQPWSGEQLLPINEFNKYTIKQWEEEESGQLGNIPINYNPASILLAYTRKQPHETTSKNRARQRPKSAAPFLQIQGRTIKPQDANNFRSKSAIGVRTHNGGGDAASNQIGINGQIGLDKGTSHWRSWSSLKQDCEQNHDDLSLYRLTSDTFRSLSQQAKKVNQQLRNKYHNSGFKSYYVVDDKTVPVLRRSQLAAGHPSQPPSICSPTPNEEVAFKPSEDLQCTTVRGTARKKRPQSSFVRSTRPKAKHPPRPKSSIATILGNDDDDDSTASSSSSKGAKIENNFDQITPTVIKELGKGEDTEFLQSQPGPFDIVREAEKPRPESSEDDEGSSCDADEDACDKDIDGSQEDRKARTKEESLCSDASDDTSDDEPEFQTSSLPDLDLPPEDPDVEDIPGSFDYHTSNMPRERQDGHPEPLSSPWCHMDLLELSESRNWRKEVRTVPEGVEEQMMDRLIEIERMQADTAHWEKCQGRGSTKPPSTLQVRKGWNANAAVPTERAQSALLKPRPSKNCHKDCMQPACAGDCKSRDMDKGCPHCKQAYCSATCTEYEYHLYGRIPRDEDDPMPTRSRSCWNCGINRNSMKSIVNANRVVLGRPKSAFATFSSGRHQVAKPKASAASLVPGAMQVSNELATLELQTSADEQVRPHTARARPRPKGRDAIQPGKSFQSQRRNSLTEKLVTTSAAGMNSRAMRARSARTRVQKRCQSAKK